jgi:hypothetical protein
MGMTWSSNPCLLNCIEAHEIKDAVKVGLALNKITRLYPEVSGLASWSENCKWYSSLPLGAVVSLFYESV